MYTVGEGILSNEDFIDEIAYFNQKKFFVKTNKKIEYYNIPAAFDIEVSSFRQNDEKKAIMYIWQIGIYNLVTIGRSWAQLTALLNKIIQVLELSDTRRLIVYVHNLPYEFQFIRKRFEWQKVFLLSERKPVYAIKDGIEFRCSLKLAGGKSLENVGKDLKRYRVQKAMGNLDYSILRTPLTPLNDKEMLYVENDIRVLLSYIQCKIEDDGDITKIPLTNTGYVRNYCRKECFTRWKRYHGLMQNLMIEPEEYIQLKRAFQGGFTHANAHYVNKVMTDVTSYDFASSYPSVMLLEKFPMSKARMIDHVNNDEELHNLLIRYCCLFDIEIIGLMPKLYNDHPISRSKCYVCDNPIVDNGRIVMADRIATTITEQDYFVYLEYYTWEACFIKNFRIYEKNYLPTKFVKAVLKLYGDKTSLKDIEGQELNYMISKNMINAAYGMMVTDPIRDNLEYIGDEYTCTKPDLEESINNYNNNVRRFLFYPWGVWVTAYARANLFSGIAEMGDDYIYADTDSVKILNAVKHKEYIDRYNKQIGDKIKAASEYHRIDSSLFMPKSPKGKIKTIGIWDYDGHYEKFKTLGAKRYLTESVQSTALKRQLTVAGVHKKKAMLYLDSFEDPFEKFENNLVIPKDYSGRLVLTYIDEEIEGDIIDCYGVPYHYHEMSSIHMENSDYHLTQSNEFVRYLKEIVDFGE